MHHLEAASDLSSDILAVRKQFVEIFSNNATNFIGAEAELKNFCEKDHEDSVTNTFIHNIKPYCCSIYTPRG